MLLPAQNISCLCISSYPETYCICICWSNFIYFYRFLHIELESFLFNFCGNYFTVFVTIIKQLFISTLPLSAYCQSTGNLLVVQLNFLFLCLLLILEFIYLVSLEFSRWIDIPTYRDFFLIYIWECL